MSWNTLPRLVSTVRRFADTAAMEAFLLMTNACRVAFGRTIAPVFELEVRRGRSVADFQNVSY
jgi:hypothetical protein